MTHNLDHHILEGYRLYRGDIRSSAKHILENASTIRSRHALCTLQTLALSGGGSAPLVIRQLYIPNLQRVKSATTAFSEINYLINDLMYYAGSLERTPDPRSFLKEQLD